jgi:hypothetical protein
MKKGCTHVARRVKSGLSSWVATVCGRVVGTVGGGYLSVTHIKSLAVDGGMYAPSPWRIGRAA